MSGMQKNSRVTLRDIADEIGVSHVTVSLALRNHPRISVKLREKIQAKALTMGYRPDPMLAALAHYRRAKAGAPIKAAIAWINCWPNPADLRAFKEFDSYWKGASACAEKFGYHLEEFVINEKLSLKRLETILFTRSIGGIIIPPHPAMTELDDFNWNAFSVVRLGRSIKFPPTHIITSDQAQTSMLAFEEIRNKGYQKIGFIGDASTSRMFSAGFMLAQTESKKENMVPPLLYTGHPREYLENHLPHWMKKYTPDAIITESPEAPEVLLQSGYRIPDDVALAGLSILDGHIDAGINQNPVEIGRVAMLAVISLINDNSHGIPPIPRQILIEGSWVDGPSMPIKKLSQKQL